MSANLVIGSMTEPQGIGLRNFHPPIAPVHAPRQLVVVELSVLSALVTYLQVLTAAIPAL